VQRRHVRRRRAKNENTIDPAGTPVAVASVGVDVDDDSPVEEPGLRRAVHTRGDQHDRLAAHRRGEHEVDRRPDVAGGQSLPRTATTCRAGDRRPRSWPSTRRSRERGRGARCDHDERRKVPGHHQPSPVVGTTIGSVETAPTALSPAVANARKSAATSHPPIRTRRTGRTRQPGSCRRERTARAGHVGAEVHVGDQRRRRSRARVHVEHEVAGLHRRRRPHEVVAVEARRVRARRVRDRLRGQRLAAAPCSRCRQPRR
jgi:hypothetical protein